MQCEQKMKNFCFKHWKQQRTREHLLRFAQEAMMAIKYGFIITKTSKIYVQLCHPVAHVAIRSSSCNCNEAANAHKFQQENSLFSCICKRCLMKRYTGFGLPFVKVIRHWSTLDLCVEMWRSLAVEKNWKFFPIRNKKTFAVIYNRNAFLWGWMQLKAK